MKAYGRINGKTIELKEVILVGDNDEIMELIPFIKISLERNAFYSESGEGCHTHFSEWNKEWRYGDLEITIGSKNMENERNDRKGEKNAI